jgi:presenilin-like A22 family membrane protease
MKWRYVNIVVALTCWAAIAIYFGRDWTRRILLFVIIAGGLLLWLFMMRRRAS